jgi:SAM-dependent methyltransferase
MDNDSRGDLFTKAYFADTYGCDGLRRFGQHWWSVRLYASITRRWMRIIHGQSLLEVGCGHGFILGELEKDYDTFGVDVSPYAVEQTARFAPRSECQVCDIENGLPVILENRTFDCILARYVLEHLRDPGRAMKTLADRLRPGGILFFSVPNTESMGARWKGDDWYARKDPTHVSLLAPDRWLSLTRQAGLRMVKEFSDGYWDIPYVSGIPMWLQRMLFLGPTVVACLTGRDLLPARFGENIMVIARKPSGKGDGR